MTLSALFHVPGRLILILLVSVFFIGACQPHSQGMGNKEKQPKDSATTVMPLQGAVSVALISFNTRPHATDKDYYFLSKSNYVKPERFDRTVELNPVEKVQLDSILSTSGQDVSNKSECYSPKHAILMYNSDHLPYAYIELAFVCRGYKISEDVPLKGISAQGWEKLQAFFLSHGFKEGF